MTDIIVCDKKQFDEGKASGVDIKVCTDDRGDDIVACPDEECSGVQDPMTINLSAGNSVDTGDFGCNVRQILLKINTKSFRHGRFPIRGVPCFRYSVK